jgi:hypothetical protein
MKMKRLLILLCILTGGTILSFAYDGYNQHLSPDEFKAKQKAFITEKAGLTEKEANKFFPLYFELQDKKKEINDKAWELMRKGKDDKMTDAQYEEIILQVYDLRIETDNLDKAYYVKFKKTLSPRKIFQVHKAEAKFHREMLKTVQPPHKGEQQKGKR